MIELKVEIEQIDYVSIVSVLFPILKKEAEKSNDFWASIVKKMDTPDESTIRGVLKLLNQNMKDKLASAMLNKYKDALPEMLTTMAASNGITLKVKNVDICNK